ncbi:hypothetical protein JTE90_016878 [Oedothorax gibbosus]|uniref:Uncharacterized protein n=1 Tax=Oedothorax gibbosus TaxID=931172 RepID=A0AAV6UAG5_9ARAC|nr:hypothetical protein JTE90_016878 [Oedothorax gibbosus]
MGQQEVDVVVVLCVVGECCEPDECGPNECGHSRGVHRPVRGTNERGAPSGGRTREEARIYPPDQGIRDKYLKPVIHVTDNVTNPGIMDINHNPWPFRSGDYKPLLHSLAILSRQLGMVIGFVTKDLIR